MTLDIAADRDIFFNDFAESLRFRADSAATPQAITANVNRQPVTNDNAAPMPGARRPLMHIMVPNGGDNGVAAASVVEDRSEIEVAYPKGGTARWRRVVRILRHNDATMLLEVGA